jgi:hypothetical protein
MQQADFLVRQRYMGMTKAPGEESEEISNLKKIYHELTELLTNILSDNEGSIAKMNPKKVTKSALVNNSLVSFEEMLKKTPVF